MDRESAPASRRTVSRVGGPLRGRNGGTEAAVRAAVPLDAPSCAVIERGSPGGASAGSHSEERKGESTVNSQTHSTNRSQNAAQPGDPLRIKDPIEGRQGGTRREGCEDRRRAAAADRFLSGQGRVQADHHQSARIAHDGAPGQTAASALRRCVIIRPRRPGFTASPSTARSSPRTARESIRRPRTLSAPDHL